MLSPQAELELLGRMMSAWTRCWNVWKRAAPLNAEEQSWVDAKLDRIDG